MNDSARSVVDPAPPEFDPYELGVPRAVANVLVVPERWSSRFNLEAMKQCVRIGNGKTGGAAMIFESVEVSVTDGSPMGGLMEGYTKDRGKPVSLKMMSGAERARFAEEELGVGYTVLRHIQDGDVVMFNRQPTLHRGSWMAFLARVTDKLSFQLPVVVTSPFNADFDGDEMNLHVALSKLAQGEASDDDVHAQHDPRRRDQLPAVRDGHGRQRRGVRHDEPRLVPGSVGADAGDDARPPRHGRAKTTASGRAGAASSRASEGQA